MACLTGNAGTTLLVLSLPLSISTHDESSIGTEFGEKLMIKMDRTKLLSFQRFDTWFILGKRVPCDTSHGWHYDSRLLLMAVGLKT